MKKLLLLLTAWLPLATMAQEQGIHFEHALSWKEVKAKAKKEGKFIFMDCFTTWCGPCKMMSREIFPLQVVGEFFNDKFVSVKVQMDKTPQDDEAVKSWYADAAAIAKEYSVMAYPTFLYFSPEGKLVHLVVGGDSATGFIAASAKALKPETQYYTRMETTVKQAGNQPDTLKRLAEEALEVYDGRYSVLFAGRYLKAVPDVFAPEVVRFMDKFTRSSKDPGFAIFRKNPEKINQVMGSHFAENRVQQIIMGEEIYKDMRGGIPPDVKAVTARLQKKYPDLAPMLVQRFQLSEYLRNKAYDQFEKNVQAYVKKYNKQLSPSELNGYARSIGRFGTDTAMLRTALAWSESASKENATPDAATVQAVLWYKLGDAAKAVSMQETAVNMLPAGEEYKYMRESYQKTLDKMKKGEKL
ncbi:thioredoxin fold domain-containing protein [Chitinophaga qingshengii]|uniref:DUF255 domain-containing protein n=1 Tax=Chitinophaga qingshengii TaxID=1569794 RepID=A0ABR7TWW9_9BACT|nr:thioredoxin fold domain-containing protein [Chitinophaga qingshengii]MBC9934969.1 DUF255 domain-containing protein [Chitinophaga qingshengii]